MLTGNTKSTPTVHLMINSQDHERQTQSFFFCEPSDVWVPLVLYETSKKHPCCQSVTKQCRPWQPSLQTRSSVTFGRIARSFQRTSATVGIDNIGTSPSLADRTCSVRLRSATDVVAKDVQLRDHKGDRSVFNEDENIVRSGCEDVSGNLCVYGNMNV